MTARTLRPAIALFSLVVFAAASLGGCANKNGSSTTSTSSTTTSTESVPQSTGQKPSASSSPQGVVYNAAYCSHLSYPATTVRREQLRQDLNRSACDIISMRPADAINKLSGLTLAQMKSDARTHAVPTTIALLHKDLSRVHRQAVANAPHAAKVGKGSSREEDAAAASDYEVEPGFDCYGFRHPQPNVWPPPGSFPEAEAAIRKYCDTLEAGQTVVSVAQPASVPCDQVASSTAAPNPQGDLAADLARINCDLKKINENASPEQQTVAYATEDPKNGGRFLFNTLSVSQADDLNTACKVVTTGFLAAESSSVAGILLAGPAGEYTCNQYYAAAAQNDPLLIVFPTLIPSEQFVGAAVGVAQGATQSLIGYYKSNPGMLIAPTLDFQITILKKIVAIAPKPQAPPLPTTPGKAVKAAICVATFFLKC